jgi:thioredoxin reductase (NADPH)
MLTPPKGTGCQAALEAEKWLAEQEDVDVPNGIEGETEAKKGVNGAVPEYRQNPLL